MTQMIGIPEDKVNDLMSSTSDRALLSAFGDDGPIIEIHMHPDHPDAILCFDRFQRGFVCVSDQARRYAKRGDEDALPAINRMWHNAPDNFRPVKRGFISQEPLTSEPGFIGELTDADRARLRAIIRKEHKRWFADHPTDAQCDNLIEGLGLHVAQKIVKAQLDAGKID